MKKTHHKKKTHKFLTAFLFAVSVALAGVIAAAYHQGKLKSDIDPETLCPKVGASSITVVMIDLTDPISVAQKEVIRRSLDDLARQIEIGGILEVYTIGSISKSLLHPIVKICNPGQGKNVSKYIANQERVEKRWKERYFDPLEKVLTGVVERSTTEAISPIMESIKSAAITSFSGQSKKGKLKRLFVISDLIENSELLNQYQGIRPFSRFNNTPGYITGRANLEDVEVYVLYIRRPGYSQVQGKTHVDFWQEYIHSTGGRLTKVTSID